MFILSICEQIVCSLNFWHDIITHLCRDGLSGQPFKLLHTGKELEGGKKLMDYDKIVLDNREGKTIELFAIPRPDANNNSAQAASSVQAAAPSHSVKINPSPVRSYPARNKSPTDHFEELPCFWKVICGILLIPFFMIYGVVVHAKQSPVSFCFAITTFFVFEIIGIVHLSKEPYYAQVSFSGVECGCLEGYGTTSADDWLATDKNPYQDCGENCFCKNLCSRRWDGDQDSTQTCPGILTYGSVCWANFECATGSSDICSVGDPAQVTFDDCFTEWECEALHQNEILSWNSTGSVSLMYKKPFEAYEELYLDEKAFYDFGWGMIGAGFLAYCVCTGGVHKMR